MFHCLRRVKLKNLLIFFSGYKQKNIKGEKNEEYLIDRSSSNTGRKVKQVSEEKNVVPKISHPYKVPCHPSGATNGSTLFQMFVIFWCFRAFTCLFFSLWKIGMRYSFASHSLIAILKILWEFILNKEFILISGFCESKIDEKNRREIFLLPRIVLNFIHFETNLLLIYWSHKWRNENFQGLH